MTLVVFPEGSQQPSTSGHQCRSGGNRMAGAGQSSKPEMYSRAVQTGFPHTPENANLQQTHQQLPICVCGQADENCWCESLGFLKDQELCRVVLQKGCPRSRVALLLSMHEEFCKSARGDPIINTRRRGSAHGDIRVRRSKAAPPPTLPRPRAQSVIVQNTRAANRLNEVNAKRSPQVSVKPKKSVDPNQQGQLHGKGKCGNKVLTKKDQQYTKEKKCLERNVLSNGTASKEESSSAEEGSHLDQTSYVSKAWLLFTGCEKGKKSKESVSKPEALCDKNPNSEEVPVNKASKNQSARLEGSLQSDKKDDPNRITGLSVSSKRKVTNKDESTPMSSESSNKNASHLKVRKSDESLQTSAIFRSDKEQRVGKSDISDECDRTALLDRVTIPQDEVESTTLGACHLDPQDSIMDQELSILISLPQESRVILKDRGVNDLDQNSELAGNEVNERLKDNGHLNETLALSVLKVDRVSCQDKEIGNDVSDCESRLGTSHDVTVIDKSETEDGMIRTETENFSLSAASSSPCSIKEDDCNIESRQINNSQEMGSSLLKIAQGKPCSESTLQVEDDSLLGACAILKKDQSVCNKCNSSEGNGIAKTSPENKVVSCHSPTWEEEFPVLPSIGIDEDEKLTSNQQPPISEIQSCEASRQVVKSAAGIDAEHHIKVNFNVKQDESKRMKKDDVIMKQGTKNLHQKVSRRSENEKIKERKHQRIMNPRKVGMLKYLICQSPLILSELNDSDFEDSDSESEDLSYNQEDRFATFPVEIVLKIVRELCTRDLAQLKVTCKNFYWLIKKYNIVGVDSRWVENGAYRDDPCMKCGKVRDRRGDVSLCYFHPKYYYRTGNGRHHWTCCLNTSRDAPGCVEGLHDNQWTTSKVMKRSIPRQWSFNMWHLCPHKDNMDP
ncbi:uncharacterized protein LOC129255047 [Lytechinus pictus]|uniref:uncharacterized protein LOC129255047 n=1 Tax=Lytechinus pictus TaxID=7653 RepID=UPI0030BA1278